MNIMVFIFLFLVFVPVTNFAAEVSRDIIENSEPFPTVLRFDIQIPRASPAAGAITPRIKPTSYFSLVDFDYHNGSLAAGRTLTIATNPDKASLENFTTFIAISKDIISWAPANLKIDSGLSYYFPVSRHFSAFASIKPTLTNLFTAPQTMVEAGFHIPVSDGKPGGFNAAFKFSTAVDQQFRPVVFFTFNLTPFKK